MRDKNGECSSKKINKNKEFHREWKKEGEGDKK